MHKKIIVSFPSQTAKEQRATLTNMVNTFLQKIHKEVTGWNGFVDYVESEPGICKAIAQCDNDEIREMMQILLDEGFAQENASHGHRFPKVEIRNNQKN